MAAASSSGAPIDEKIKSLQEEHKSLGPFAQCALSEWACVCVVAVARKAPFHGMEAERAEYERSHRAMDLAKERLEESVKRGHAANKVGRRYRRREKVEKDGLTDLQRQEREAKAERDALRARELRADEHKAEVARLQADVVATEAGHKKAMDVLDLAMRRMGLGDHDKGPTLAALKEVDERIWRIEAQMTHVEAEATEKWKRTNAPITDRSITDLFGDIVRSTHWMTDPREGMSSSEVVQRLETIQQSIEKKQLPISHEYAQVTAYFLYSATRQAPIMLEKEKSYPATWGYRHYYQCTPLAEVQKIFRSCNGRAVEPLATDKPVDRLEFADL